MKEKTSKKMLWTGRILSTLVVLFMLLDGVVHILNIPPVVQAFGQLGFPDSLAIPIGIIQLLCLALYIFPRTSVLGAILLTGYLGGAVATNLRVGVPLFLNILFPVYVGILLWGGLFFREEKLRHLLPFKK